MRAKKLLLLGCGLEQIEALRIARELGYATVAFDNDAKAVGRAHADEFFRVDLKDPHQLLGQAEIAAPDGVFVHAAELAVEAACIGEALDLPNLGVESARAATDKRLRIERLSRAGLRTPRFRSLQASATQASWLETVRDIGFPCILKPTNQAGARGVERIGSPDELRLYHARRETFGSMEFLCEEELEGLQLSTESVITNGKILHHAIALRHYDTTLAYRPCFIEDGHSLPYALPPALRAAVENVIARAFLALEIGDGVLKGDLLIDGDPHADRVSLDESKVCVLEMAARTSGGRFADTVVPLATGVNILYPLIEQAMGDAYSRNWFSPTRHIGVSQRFFLHESAGRVERWPLIRRLVSSPWVVDWQIDEDRFASRSLPDLRSHRDRFGYVICTGSSREEADARALEITTDFSDALVMSPDDRSEAP